MTKISEETLTLFKTDLWKDQRDLSTATVKGIFCLRKSADDLRTALIEASVLRELTAKPGRARVPRIVCRRKNDLYIEYFGGIRLFNLLVYLDRLAFQYPTATGIARKLICEAGERQADIQQILFQWARHRALPPYPAAQKITRALKVLQGPLDLDIDWGRLGAELNRIGAIWTSYAVVPFRDAAPKNMILAATELVLNQDGENARQAVLAKTFEKCAAPAWSTAKVVDVDFASCGELTTPEDDYISLFYHERTWAGPPTTSSDLSWGFDTNADRAGMTFLVRYMRFGARKAAYRLLHPTGHRMRFMYDSDLFYFEKLPIILDTIWPGLSAEFPYLRRVIDILPRRLGAVRASSDPFLESGLAERRPYYTDVFPL